jgi:hypothetical protein
MNRQGGGRLPLNGTSGDRRRLDRGMDVCGRLRKHVRGTQPTGTRLGSGSARSARNGGCPRAPRGFSGGPESRRHRRPWWRGSSGDLTGGRRSLRRLVDPAQRAVVDVVIRLRGRRSPMFGPNVVIRRSRRGRTVRTWRTATVGRCGGRRHWRGDLRGCRCTGTGEDQRNQRAADEFLQGRPLSSAQCGRVERVGDGSRTLIPDLKSVKKRTLREHSFVIGPEGS